MNYIIMDYGPYHNSVLLENGIVRLQMRATHEVQVILQRFLREIGIITKLRQFNEILPVFDIQESEGMVSVFLPYNNSISLYEKIKNEGPLSVEDAIPIMTKILKALDHIHQLGISHGFLSAEGILLKSNEEICILGVGMPYILVEEFDNCFRKYCLKTGMSYRTFERDFQALGQILIFLITGVVIQKDYKNHIPVSIVPIIKKTRGEERGYRSCTEFIQDLECCLSLNTCEVKKEYGNNSRAQGVITRLFNKIFSKYHQ